MKISLAGDWHEALNLIHVLGWVPTSATPADFEAFDQIRADGARALYVFHSGDARAWACRSITTGEYFLEIHRAE